MILSAIVSESEDSFIALNPETGTTTQGDTFDVAMQNLQEATSLFLEVFPVKNVSKPPVMTSFELVHG